MANLGVDLPAIELVGFTSFLIGSVLLVWQDVRWMSVSQSLLFLVLGLWVAIGFWSDAWQGAAAFSAGVLTIGGCLLLLSPGFLGEADILYMAGLAWLLPFWSVLLALGLACLLGLSAYAFFFVRTKQYPNFALPYLPCLALGGLGAFGGSL